MLREEISRRAVTDLFDISDPFSAFISRVRGRHCSHILFKFKRPLYGLTDADLEVRNAILRLVPKGFVIDVNPISLL
jgi:hypothetical protein